MGRHFTPPRFLSLLLLLALLPLAADRTDAREVRVVNYGFDRLAGAISTPEELDIFPFEAVEGALLTLKMKVGKKEPRAPRIDIWGPDLEPLPGFEGYLKTNRKGTKLALKNLPVAETGVHYLVVSSENGELGSYEIKTKVKNPKKLTLSGRVEEAGGTGFVDVPAPPGRNVANFVILGDKSGGLIPVPLDVRPPQGRTQAIGEFKARGPKIKLKYVVFEEFGFHRLAIKGEPGTSGDFTVDAKPKYGKLEKRTVFDSEMLIPPEPVSMTPETGLVIETIAGVTVKGKFFQSGAAVILRKGDTQVRLNDVEVADNRTIRFDLDVTTMGLGIWDLVVENFDKGRGELLKAFSVQNVPAVVEGISPSSGRDDEIVSVVITGQDLRLGADVKLIRGIEEIPGEKVQVLEATQQILAEFDLRERELGLWDLEVTNREAMSDLLPDAFTILNAPPAITGFTPERAYDPSGNVTVEVLGTGFEAGATVEVTRTAETPISVTVLSVTPGKITGSMNTLSRNPGWWNATVKNTDGQTASLDEVFLVLGPVGTVSETTIDSYSFNTPAIAVNETDDEYLVVWAEKNGSGNYTIRAQRFDLATGKTVGTRAELLTGASGESGSDPRKEPAVAWASTKNRYLVAWVERLPDSSFQDENQIWAQVLEADLSKVGSAIQVSDKTDANGSILSDQDNGRPNIASDGDTFTIVFDHHWVGKGGSLTILDYDVMIRTISASTAKMDAGPSGGPFGPNMSGNREDQAAVLYSSKVGGVVLAFRETTDNTNTDNPSSTNIHLGTESTDVQFTTKGTDSMPWIVYSDALDEGLALWVRDGTDIMARRFDKALKSAGSEMTVAANTGETNLEPRAVYNGLLNEYLIVWTRVTSSGTSVQARRFGYYQAPGTSGPSWQLLGSAFEIPTGFGKEAFGMPLYLGDDREYLIPWFGDVGASSGDLLGEKIQSRRWK